MPTEKNGTKLRAALISPEKHRAFFSVIVLEVSYIWIHIRVKFRTKKRKKEMSHGRRVAGIKG